MIHRWPRRLALAAGLTFAAGGTVARAQVVTTITLDRTITLDGIAALPDGSLLGASAYDGEALWLISPSGAVRTLATGLAGPIHVAQDPSGNRYLSSYSDAGTIARVDPQGTVTTFATVPQGPAGLAFGPDGRLYVAIYGNPQGSGDAIYRIDASGHAEVFARGNGISGPVGIAFDDQGRLMVVNGRDGRVHRVTKDGTVSPVATLPKGAGFFSAGHLVYAGGPFFASGNTSQVVHLLFPDGRHCPFAGSGERGTRDGSGPTAQFIVPNGLALSADRRTLYVAHGGGGPKQSIRRVTVPPLEQLQCP